MTEPSHEELAVNTLEDVMVVTGTFTLSKLPVDVWPVRPLPMPANVDAVEVEEVDEVDELEEVEAFAKRGSMVASLSVE